jgi:hypothetical protein
VGSGLRCTEYMIEKGNLIRGAILEAAVVFQKERREMKTFPLGQKRVLFPCAFRGHGRKGRKGVSCHDLLVQGYLSLAGC